MRFLALFGMIALAEMATFFWVESRIGLGWALGLALGTAFIGSMLVRRAGLAVWGAIQTKFRQGQLPGRELTHGAAILVAGAFLISPGFLTDTLGFLLLIPALRDVIHSVVSRRLTSRMTVVTGVAADTRRTRQDAADDVIDVEGWETEGPSGNAPGLR